ncbi:hypothetical protein ABK046_46380, partial [Streptomyces caeruleatus]
GPHQKNYFDSYDLLFLAKYLKENLIGEKKQNRNESDEELNVVRDIGFDTMIFLGNMTEKIFFIDSLGNNSYYASEDALRNFIDYQMDHINL